MRRSLLRLLARHRPEPTAEPAPLTRREIDRVVGEICFRKGVVMCENCYHCRLAIECLGQGVAR